MASGCLVLVDGWNHFLKAEACFGRTAATRFPVDRLATHVASAAGEDTVTDAVVVMAIPDRNVPGEENAFWEWRNRLKALSNHGVRHEKAKFKYRTLTCPACGNPVDRKAKCLHCPEEIPLPGRRAEKGADILLATLALSGAWRQDYSSLVILAQDSDYGPLVRQLKEVHLQQGRRYNLYSAFPVCEDPAHDHRPVPATKPLPLDLETYEKLIAQPHVNPLK